MERYRNYLDYERMNPNEFEAMHRKMILRQRLFAVVTENVVVPDFELDASYRAVSDLFDLYYLEVKPADFEDRVEIGADELNLYYDEHKEEYREAPKTVIEYIRYDFDDYAAEIKVSDEDARDFYDTHRSLYSTPETSQARHILIKVAQDASGEQVAEAEAKAAKVLEEARGGADFAALAREYSDDKASAVKGGFLGEVRRGSLVDGLDDKLFAMKKGDIDGPFRTRFGFHLVKVDSVTEAQIKPFEEVAGEISARLKAARARDMAYAAADKAFMTIYQQNDMDLKAFAAEQGLTVQQLGPFAEGDTLKQGKQIVSEAFRVAEGDLGDVVELQDGFMVFKVTERRPSRIPSI